MKNTLFRKTSLSSLSYFSTAMLSKLPGIISQIKYLCHLCPHWENIFIWLGNTTQNACFSGLKLTGFPEQLVLYWICTISCHFHRTIPACTFCTCFRWNWFFLCLESHSHFFDDAVLLSWLVWPESQLIKLLTSWNDFIFPVIATECALPSG